MSIAASDIIAAGKRLGMDAEALLSLVAEIDAAKAAGRRAIAAERQRRHRESVTQNRVTSVTSVTDGAEPSSCHAFSRDMRDMRDGDGSPPASPSVPPRDIINPPSFPSAPHSAGWADAQARGEREPGDAIGEFRKSIVAEFARVGSATVPDTSRAGLWIAQGRRPDVCLAVIAEGLARKPSVRALSYFDAAIADAHAPAAARAPPAGRSPPRPTMATGLLAHVARQDAARADR